MRRLGVVDQFCASCEDHAVLFAWRGRWYVRCVGSCGKVREVEG